MKERITVPFLFATLLFLISVIAAPPASALRNGLIEREIRYYMPEAGEVWLVWGVDGWQILPPEMWPSGTVIKDDLMNTPMREMDDHFQIMLEVPPQAKIDYGFKITKSYDGTAISEAWESGFKPIDTTQYGITKIRSARTLPLNPLASLATDIRFRGGAMLQLAAGFLLVLGVVAGIAVWPKISPDGRLTRIDHTIIELVLALIVLKVILLGVAYLGLAAFDVNNPELVFFQSGYLKQLFANFDRGDVQWYMSIANEGYEARPFSVAKHANWAFYPLWPLMLRLSNYLPVDMVTWGILLANTLSIVAIVGVYLLVLLDFDKRTAILTALLTAAFPAAYFFSRPGPEAIFLLLVVFSLYAGRKQQWMLAGGLGALATLTRLNGFLLFPTLLYLYYRQYKTTNRHQIAAVALFLIPAAILLHMTYLYYLTGNFFASLDIQAVWDNNLSYPFAAMVRFLSRPVLVDYYGLNLAPVSFLFVFGAVVIAVIAAVMWRQKRYPAYLLIFMWLNLFVFVSRDNLNASVRYMAVIFPLFLALVLLLQRRRVLIALLFFIFIALQVFYTMAFVQGINWAIT